MTATETTPRRHVDVAERRARLGVRHLLAPGRSATDAAGVAAALGGALHATDPATPHLSVALRLDAPRRDALDAALLDDRSLVRHHAMRRTLWIMEPDVLGAAHRACTVAIAAKEWTRFASMLRDNGVNDPDAWLASARPRALEVVGQLESCTARQLGVAAPELALPLEIAPGKPYAATQGAHTRLVQNLGFDGAIVRTESVGSWISGEYRWVVSERWLPGGVVGTAPADLDDACRRLAAAYLRAFGPVTTADLQWWAGWTAATTRRALDAAGAVPVTVDEGADGSGDVVTAWLSPDDLDPVAAPDGWAAVLPSLDPTVMGWKHRAWYAGPHAGFGHTVFDRNGNAGNAVLVDGVVVGTWAQRLDGTVAVRYLDSVPASRRSMVDVAVDRYLGVVGDVVVRPRFPAPLHRELMRDEP